MTPEMLFELRTELGNLRQEVAKLDELLRDYWRRREALRAEIVNTFPNRLVDDDEDGSWRPPRRVVERWTRDGAVQRFGIYPELDRLNFEFAPITSERRNLKIEADSLQRMLDQEIGRPKPKQRKRQAQGVFDL